MKSSKKLNQALKITKYSVTLLRCWPPAQNASKLQNIIFDLSWWIMFVSSLCLLVPLLASIYVYRYNAEIVTKSICLFCAVSQCTIKTLFCRLRRKKLESILGEMEDYLNNINTFDRGIMEKYVSRCATLHFCIIMWTYFTSISFIVIPLFVPQGFPTDAVYPFSLENTYVSVLIYAHQSLVGLQTSAAVLLDCLVAVLIWFVCARFEILALTIDNCKNFDDMRQYLKRYRSLLRYTNDVRGTVDLLVFATVTTSVGGVLFSLIQLVSDQSLAIKAQYIVVAITASASLYTCSWAADNLLEKEYMVGTKAFHSSWFNMEKKARTTILHLIMQSQKPITIKANRMLPTLSLAFYSQFLYTSFRFFAALRVMVG